MQALRHLPVLFAAVFTASAAVPNFSGVWKLNPEKSKMANAPHGTTLVVLTQEGDKLTETNGTIGGPRPPVRQVWQYDLSGKDTRNIVRGVPLKTHVTVEGDAAVAESTGPSSMPSNVHEKFWLSENGQELHVERTGKMFGRDMNETLVFDKQPESEGEVLRGPEKTAGEVEKNVKLLKDLPYSQFLNTMASFNTALGVRCDFCHEEGNFASDAKQTKLIARKMIEMTHGINQTYFNGHMEVGCYTCHRGSEQPHRMPQ